ncbi:ribonuclease P protein component [Algoriphagus kandeliae]|uniref:Ribonuclease P protein component n=1 Tax=Algoriphagus kandeliae TaxID=2562278 RepID=A0A4Y9QKT4_9BACT|nr:ribonuclease P protein component [Algoriphagus kandeliae]TFV92202.1 ribonuclease P protein component [Algoriphagus kandeliae]
MNFRLPKTERLYSQKSIKELFDEGSSFFLYPFKVLYLVKEGESHTSNPNQVLFSVSKRKIKKATGRNLMKRRMREAYRINKHLLSNSSRQLFIGLLYVSSEAMDFKSLEEKTKKVLERIESEVKNQSHE